MEEMMDRCPTGIIGFDKLCQGGFVRNSDNIIIGGPGTGKTTFLLQFLWNGVTKFGENGLYCSFEPDIVDTLSDGLAHGWDFSRLSEEGRMKFMRFSPNTSVDELKGELTKIISRHDIRRICFDPVSILALNLSEVGKIRQTIFDLSSLMKRLKVTTLYADEFLESEWTQQLQGDLTKTDILRFLSDSVTVLYDSGVSGVGDRALRITKMRRTAHERRAVGMEILNKGINILGPPEEDAYEIVEEEEETQEESLHPNGAASIQTQPRQQVAQPAAIQAQNSQQTSPPAIQTPAANVAATQREPYQALAGQQRFRTTPRANIVG